MGKRNRADSTQIKNIAKKAKKGGSELDGNKENIDIVSKKY
jgi:hypothetical protein